MPDPSLFEEYLRGLAPEQLQQAFRSLVPASATRQEQVATLQAALASEAGRALRAEMGRWIVDHLIPVEHLVPEPYVVWRQPVREAMLFVADHFSDARLAAKLLEQIELPPNARPETSSASALTDATGAHIISSTFTASGFRLRATTLLTISQSLTSPTGSPFLMTKTFRTDFSIIIRTTAETVAPDSTKTTSSCRREATARLISKDYRPRSP